MPLPQQRSLHDADGFRWLVTVHAGRLVLTQPDGVEVVFDRPEELRSLAPQLTRAVTEHDLAVQEAAVKASIARRHARIAAGGQRGNRHGPFTDDNVQRAAALDLEVPA